MSGSTLLLVEGPRQITMFLCSSAMPSCKFLDAFALMAVLVASL